METRRLQVFVSSTFLDLKDERAAVLSALLQLEAIPSGMELFPAADDDAWTLIQKVIDDCDYYLLVIGGRYGAIDPATEVSYTEKEFDYAVDQKKPVMAFLHAAPDEIEFGKSEKDEAARAKLEAFRSKVESTKHVKYWTSAEQLQGQVAMSFGLFKQSYPAVGWIRGDAQSSTETLSELNDLRKELEETRRQLNAARTEPPPGSDDLAQGDDAAKLRLRVHATGIPEGSTRSELDMLLGGSSRKIGPLRLVVEPTWDQIFSAIGPSLLDEAEESDLRRALIGWLASTYAKEAQARAEAELREREVLNGSARVELETDDFGTVLIQMRALGLVERSERKRSVSDKGTYWTLSPYGDEHLMKLRAIRRATEAPKRPK